MGKLFLDHEGLRNVREVRDKEGLEKAEKILFNAYPTPAVTLGCRKAVNKEVKFHL